MSSDLKHSAYADIIRGHLANVFGGDAGVWADYPGVTGKAYGFELTAFGRVCRLTPEGIFIDERPEWGPRGIIVALLARHAVPDDAVETPWQAFRELPNSAPYVGAFRSHTEQILVPHVPALHRNQAAIAEVLHGCAPEDGGPGDWGLVVEPLPKIRLCYHFYLPDEDFPANVTCLYSRNAHCFLPTDALADVGEYTSRALIDRLTNRCAPH